MFPIPTRRAAILAAVVAVVYLVVPDVRGTAFVIVNLVVLALLVVDWVTALAARRIAVERDLAPTTTLGETLPIGWNLENPSNRPVHVRFADDIVGSLRVVDRDHSVRIPRRSRAEVVSSLSPSRRGRYNFEQIVVRVDGIARLVAVQRRIAVPGQLRVLPRFLSRDMAELRIRRARMLDVGMRSAAGIGTGTEFEQLREYTVDDQFRHIDWGATARTGRPIVKTYRPERNQSITLLVDSGRLMAGRVGDVTRIEYAIDAAAALTHVATHLGDQCGLIAFDRAPRVRVKPSAARLQSQRVIEAVFDLEPSLVETDFGSMLVAATGLSRRRSMLVMLTDLLEESVLDTLLPAVTVAARRHVLVIGAVSDPSIVEWVDAAPDDPEVAYRRAAAAGALAARRRSAARLTAAGVTVVDATPGVLAARLVDTYLAIKVSGRL